MSCNKWSTNHSPGQPCSRLHLKSAFSHAKCLLSAASEMFAKHGSITHRVWHHRALSQCFLNVLLFLVIGSTIYGTVFTSLDISLEVSLKWPLEWEVYLCVCVCVCVCICIWDPVPLNIFSAVMLVLQVRSFQCSHPQPTNIYYIQPSTSFN